MDSLTQDFEIIESVLHLAAQKYSGGSERTLFAFDRENGQFVVLREGWEGYKRHHYAWIHVEYRDGKVWIHRDGTEFGIADDLLARGISRERIVLAFQHPIRRERGEFAVA